MHGAAIAVSVDVHALSASIGKEAEHLKGYHRKGYHRADFIEKEEDFQGARER
jgi:hypothetical protein